MIQDNSINNIDNNVDDTMLGGALPFVMPPFEVKKNDLFTSTLERPEISEILFPIDYNHVLDVYIENPVIKAEDGKIDISKFVLVLEDPNSPTSERATTPKFVSDEPEILEVDEKGNLTPKVELGQTYVTLTWPTGATAKVLVTIGEVSEVKPARPVYGGDVEDPDQPGGNEPENPDQPGGGDEPEPDEPEIPEEPVEEAKIMYGLMPIAEHMENIDAITAEDLAGVEFTKVDVAKLEKTLLPAVESNFIVVLVPATSSLVAYRDNGFGSLEKFSEDIMGCNGQKTYEIRGNMYKLYAELQIVSASDYFIYVE